MLLALAATAIVAIVLLWSSPAALRPRSLARVDALRARARARSARGDYDPGRELRAEQRARALLRSCVNEEEWAMYRDLGFLRVWGGTRRERRGALRLSDLPAPADRRLPARRPARCSTSTASPSPITRAPTAARACPTPTTCSRSGWRSPPTSVG